MDNTTIPPALTPDEWESSRRFEGPLYRAMRAIEGGDELSAPLMIDMPFDQQESARVAADAGLAQRVMALANDALPDGDPRKITRAHLKALDDAVSYLSHYGRGPETDSSLDLALRLSRIIDAMLPPE